jgi:hypothetical protein
MLQDLAPEVPMRHLVLSLALITGCTPKPDTGTDTSADTDTDTDTDTGNVALAEALAAGLATWASVGPTDYHFVLQWQCFCDTQMTGPALIEVVGGVVVSSTYTFDGTPTTGDFTVAAVPDLFDLVERALEDADVVTASFDPTLGYPTTAWIDGYAQAVDDELGFAVSDFVGG